MVPFSRFCYDAVPLTLSKKLRQHDLFQYTMIETFRDKDKDGGKKARYNKPKHTESTASFWAPCLRILCQESFGVVGIVSRNILVILAFFTHSAADCWNRERGRLMTSHILAERVMHVDYIIYMHQGGPSSFFLSNLNTAKVSKLRNQKPITYKKIPQYSQ